MSNAQTGWIGKLVMPSLLLLLAFACRAASDFDQGLLWKIETGGAEPSYLFGTMHIDDPAVTRLPPPVERAFQGSSGLTLEVTFDPASLMVMANAMIMTDGRTLDGLLEPRLYRRAVDAMTSHGMPEAMVVRMKPWAIAVALSLPPDDEGEVLDHSLYKRALERGIPVDGLETASEQMDVFDSLSEEEQVRFLEETLQQLPEMDKLLEELQAAYLARDLAALGRINEDSMAGGDQALADKFIQIALIDRNHTMVQRMQPHLARGKRFIAVGALHLPGDEGILQLLKDRGYQLTRLY